MEKISVIIPVYNTKNELEKCLCSIQNQTYYDLEIICIDDGSTDGSEKIVDDFAKQDSRFNVIHQHNGGESSARNTGLKIATGEVIAFCDCDDWLELNAYELLMKEMKTYDLDMVAASWYKETEQASIAIKNDLAVEKSIFSRTSLLKYLYMRDSYRGFAYMWDKLYKRKLLKDVDCKFLMFDENLALGGDVVYLAKAALNVKRAKYIDCSVYHYNQRRESGCHTKDVCKLRDWIKAYDIVINLFETQKINKEIIDYVKRFFVYHSSNAVETAIEQKAEKEKKEFQKLMKLYENEYMELNREHPDRISRYYRLLYA